MDLQEAGELCPHLMSPAHLAMADSGGKWKPVPHLMRVNEELMKAWVTPNSRTAIVIPYQHGKSLISSINFPAWVLLLWPETRVALGSYEENFACNFGAKVRDIVMRYGPALGIHIREDTSAKGEWVIDKYGGGMVCKGRGGALVGRPADLLILDDMLKNAVEAQSPTILENLWDWFCTVAYSRLGPTAPVIAVGTRWCPKDLFGRWEAEAKVGGDKFNFVHFKAIAGKDDLLGRNIGEALWPERVPLDRLQRIAKRQPRWFKACWQGEPEESRGLHFQPREWPKYVDVGDAWRVWAGTQWNHYRKAECTIVVAIDWAQKGKRASDKTAFVVAAFTDDGRVLVLDVFNERLRYEENRGALEKYCRLWEPISASPLIVAGDDDMLSEAMVVECRRSPHIPEVRRMPIHSRSKIVRAQAGIIRSQNGLFLLPDPQREWYEELADQLTAFTGDEGAEDDIPDCLGILGRLADEWKPGEERSDLDPLFGTSGYEASGVYPSG